MGAGWDRVLEAGIYPVIELGQGEAREIVEVVGCHLLTGIPPAVPVSLRVGGAKRFVYPLM